ncbi:hypothetical protein [Methylocystis echinoides]|uniref:hypothetical protein n=1 Tax=Methylocystis echinoides TaxID=29468 RepID=UPI002493C45E|nr:hypothetical protein [Methylocystis echinoides]
MSNMKIITLVTVTLMVTVFLLHGMTYFMKFVLGTLLFAGWLVFAIARAARERRKARRPRDNVRDNV